MGHEEYQLKGFAFVYNVGEFLILLKIPGPLKTKTMLNGLANLHGDLFFSPDSAFNNNSFRRNRKSLLKQNPFPVTYLWFHCLLNLLISICCPPVFASLPPFPFALLLLLHSSLSVHLFPPTHLHKETQ